MTAIEKKFVTGSAEDTIAIAKELAASLTPGSVIRLEGDLGAGKTTFVKGIALGLGLRKSAEVKSPTFVILHIYPTRVPLYHFDLYRLDERKDLSAIGFEDFVNDPAAIKCVEWAEKASSLFPEHSIRVQLKIVGENQRAITISS